MSQVALPILGFTVALALLRPRIGAVRIGPPVAAVLGAALTLALGVVSPAAAVAALSSLVFPLIAIVSLMALTLVADQSGLFELGAQRIARAARGDGRRLFTGLFVVGTATGAVFTNDAAVLIFTPLVHRLVVQVRDDSWTPATEIPYYFAVLYVANLVGAFVISNPINIVVASVFEIEFLEYARWMMLPAVVSMVSSYWGLRAAFRGRIVARYDTARLGALPPADCRFVALTSGVLGLTLVGFFLEHLTGVPIWAVALLAAVALLVLCRLAAQVDPGRVLRGIGWDAVVFVAGIFVVVTGIREAGLTVQLERLVAAFSALGVHALTLVTGFAAAACAAVMNNHPTAYAFALAIEGMPLEEVAESQWLVKRMLVFSALIGGDLGPKMLPIGSLAALLWFRMLRDRGVEIPYWLYVKIGIPVTLLAVLLSLLTLDVEILVAGWMAPALFP